MKRKNSVEETAAPSENVCAGDHWPPNTVRASSPWSPLVWCALLLTVSSAAPARGDATVPHAKASKRREPVVPTVPNDSPGSKVTAPVPQARSCEDAINWAIQNMEPATRRSIRTLKGKERAMFELVFATRIGNIFRLGGRSPELTASCLAFGNSLWIDEDNARETAQSTIAEEVARRIRGRSEPPHPPAFIRRQSSGP